MRWIVEGRDVKRTPRFVGPRRFRGGISSRSGTIRIFSVSLSRRKISQLEERSGASIRARSRKLLPRQGCTYTVQHNSCGAFVMAATNITIRVDSELALAAKVLAARRGTSVSRLVSEQLEVLVQRDRAYEVAKRRALRRLSNPVELKWNKPRSRDELHERG
jgi:hypothetical protein